MQTANQVKENRICGIYGILDQDNNIIYVGKSVHIERRVKQHGCDKYKVLQLCEKYQLKNLEIYWIRKLTKDGIKLDNGTYTDIKEDKELFRVHLPHEKAKDLKIYALNNNIRFKNLLEQILISYPIN